MWTRSALADRSEPSPGEKLRTAGLIAVVGALAYAVRIPGLGFYFDSWYLAWEWQARGPAGLIQFANSVGRPLQGFVLALTHPLVELHVVALHSFVFLLRLLGALAFLWMLRGLWPARRRETTITCLLFLVYPGFLQQASTTMYLGYLVSLFLIAISLGATAWALRSERRTTFFILTLVALGSQLSCHLSIESYFGLDLVRPFLIWHIVGEGHSHLVRRAVDVFKRWLPYCVVAATVLIWRVVLLRTDSRGYDAGLAASRYADNPLEIVRFALRLGKDLLDTVLWAWAVPAYGQFSSAPARVLLGAFLLGLVGGCLVYFYYLRAASESPDRAPEKAWSGQALALGTAMAVSGLAPALLASGSVMLGLVNDRYTLPASPGVAILVTGALLLLIRKSMRPLTFAVLICICVGVHFANSSRYAHHWREQKDMWWQMAWRVPQLKDGAVVVVDAARNEGYFLGESFFSDDHEIWVPLNYIYRKGVPRASLYGDLLTEKLAAKLEGGGKVYYRIYGLEFDFLLENSLVVAAPNEGSCLRVVDAARQALPRGAGALLRLAAGHSRIDLIEESSPKPLLPTELLGDEPVHGWCYFYQKAESARQREAWQEVVDFWDETERKGLKPKDSGELLVFFEAFLRSGRHDEARRVEKDIAAARTSGDPRLGEAMCRVLKSAAYAAGSAEPQALGERMSREWDCAALPQRRPAP